MQYDSIMVRYGELSLKGKNRRFFEKMLIENIKRSLNGIDYDFIEFHNRYLIENFNDYDYDDIVERLKKIAGIHSFSLASVCANDPDEIIATAIELCQDKSGTFKVETNRADKTIELNSMEISAKVGGKIFSYVKGG